jgi:hypothetical protein
MPDRDDEFDQIIKGWKENTSTESIDRNPYGAPVQPLKSGLTTRGKAALAFGAAIIAGGSLIGYQIHENNNAKEQEIALKTQQVELEKLQEMNRANEAGQKTQATQARARQASIDSCVNHDAGQGAGSALYQEAVSNCQAQYAAPVNSTDLQPTASTQSTGGSVNGGVLIGGVVLVGALAVAAKKGTRSNQV